MRTTLQALLPSNNIIVLMSDMNNFDILGCMSFDLAHLRTFRVVAETSSFTRAAARLYLTQSAVSHQIKGLEEELGEALFIRTRHGVRLAQAGEAVLEHVDRIFEEVEALRRRLGHDTDQPVGRVRAAAATQALVHLFAPHFRAFMQAYPRVEVVFRSTVSTDRTVADILSGVADVGFASKPVYSATLNVTELFDDELLLVVSPDHRLARVGSASVKDIRSERLILFERGASIRRASDQFFERAGIKPDLALESNDTDFIKLMVLSGVGISLLPAWAMREEVRSGTLVPIRIRGHRLRRSVAMLSRGRFQPSATRAFIAFIEGRKRELQDAAKP
jgi:DNA-binding transcriptional LysR family regulator